MVVDYIALGEKIRKERKRCGWTQEELAEKLEISIKHVGSIERAESIPSIQVLVSMASVFQVSTDYLLFAGVSKEKNTTEMEIISLLHGIPEKLLVHILHYIHLLLKDLNGNEK